MTALPTLYKRATNKKVQEWTIIVDDDKFWTVTGYSDGQKTEHAPTVCLPKNVGKRNATTPCEQAMYEAEAKWTKQLGKHYKEDVADIDIDDYFKVMLANSYEKCKGKIDWNGALISPKLDGIRFVASGDHSHSRTGKPLGGGNVIRQWMDPLFDKFPGLILDGELYNHNFHDNFSAITKLIKREKISPKKMAEIEQYLQFHIYDVPQFDVFGEGDNYTDRFDAFWETLEKDFPDLAQFMVRVPYEPVASHDGAIQALENHLTDGYEGSIIRFDKPYEHKRTNDLIKFKVFDDDEFVIIEVLDGVGCKAGTAAKMVMQGKDGKPNFKTNIKGGFALYDKLWAKRDVMPGKTTTIQYFGYGEHGRPRFPYAIKFNREDYE